MANKEMYVVVQVDSDIDFMITDYNDEVYMSLKEAEQAAVDNAENDNGQWFVAKLISKTESEIKVVKVA